MNTIKVTVMNEQGIHARPSTKICKLTNKFEGDVNFVFNNEIYDAKNIMEIMLIGLEQGNTFEIIASGKDENKEIELLEELKTLIEIKQFK